MDDLKKTRICSLHFKKEGFELNVLGLKRVALLDIPSVFTFRDDDEQPGTSGTSSAKRIRLESPCPSTPGGLNTSASSIEVCLNDKSYQLESTIPPTSLSSSEAEGGKA